MGTLTFTELQDEVRSGLGGRTDLDARLPRAINLAQQRLARIHDFDEMEVISTTAINNTSNDSDKYITLPNKREIYSIVLLDGANSRKLIQRTPRFWDVRLPKPEYWSRQRPTDYIIWGNTIEIWPLPMATYTLRMRWSQWPVNLAGASDLSQFLQKDELLIELALVYLFNSLGKEDSADKHKSILKDLLAEAINNDDTKPDISITPDTSRSAGMSSEPWRDPFVRGT